MGCPLSGTLYAMAIDAGNWIIDSFIQLPCYGVAGGCADDSAILLFKLSHLSHLHVCIGIICKASTQQLALTKCVIVPCKSTSLHTYDLIKAWIQDNLSVWAPFSIADHAI